MNFAPNKTLTILSLLLLITGCGGGEYEPNYDDTAMPTERRIDGELAFSSPSLMKMAESFRIAGDYTNAIRIYQRAANESPRHVTSRLALGQIYQRLGAVDGATTYYKQVLELDPENGDAQFGLGQMMMNTDQVPEAIEYLEAAAAKSPDNFRIYNSIGLAYDLEGMHEQAQNAYGRGLSKQPDHISLLNNLSLSLAIEGEFAPAIQLLSKAVNLDYSQTTAQQNLIMVYALSGEEQAARAMARSFMTPDEIETNMFRYNWLRGLSTKRRAQAIFLNLSSFPDEEEEEEINVTDSEMVTPSVVSIDPKRQLLDDILNSENDLGAKTAEPSVDMAEEVEIDAEDQAVNQNEPVDPEEMIPVKIPASTGNYYRLQLGSYLSTEEVVSDWGRLNKLAPDMLATEEYNVEKIVTAENQDRYRMFIGNYDNYTAALEHCSALQNKKVPCLVLKSSQTQN